jgi:membrane protein YqaA with SNARE-associated domain
MNADPSPSSRGPFLNAMLGKPGLALAFLWGFGEATVFFIVPDVVFTFIALFSIRHSLRAIGVVLAGSLLGGSLMYEFARLDSASAKDVVGRVPFVTEAMFLRVQHDFEEWGAWAMCRGPSSGIPYKVYAVLAPGFTSWTEFLLVSIPARLERFVLSWALVAACGWLFRRPIDRHPRLSMATFALCWTLFYIWFWALR